MAKAVACLLPVPFTFHMAVDLLGCLSELVEMLELGLAISMRSTEHYSTPGNALAIATQLAASGLLQQLPAALKQAQQQLHELEPTGWCGTAQQCHYCITSKGNINQLACLLPSWLGDSDNAGRQPLQAYLLDSCSTLISFWPGGALSSTALGPTLVPITQLALSSLQYTTQQLQAQHRPVDSCPPGATKALSQLGRTALDTCLAVCAATAAPGAVPVVAGQTESGHQMEFSMKSPDECARRLTQHVQESLLHPAMLSAAVAIACAAIYGEHVADMAGTQYRTASSSSSSSSTQPANSRTAHDCAGDIFADVPRTSASAMFQQQGVCPDAELPATAWQLLSAQEAMLRPGQTLLPDLQQQLVDTLDCHGKGFLFLAPLWLLQQRLSAIKLLMLAAQGRQMVEIIQELQEQQRQPPLLPATEGLQLQNLQQHLLLPTLLLRWVVNHQRSHGSAGGTPVWLVSMALFNTKQALAYWQTLADRAAQQQQQQQQEARSTLPCSRQKEAAAGSSSGAAVNELPGPVLYEYMQLFVECLWGVLQHDSNDSSNVSAAGGSISNAGSTGGSSSKALDGLSNPAPDCFTNVPAAAGANLTSTISDLLPTVTKMVLGAEHKGINSITTIAMDGGSTGSSSSSSSCGGSSREAGVASPCLAGGCQWAPLLLRLSATLEHGMRFEARHQATGVQCWGGPSLMATYMLLSTAAHGGTPSLRSWARAAAVPLKLPWVHESAEQRCSLLHWLLESSSRTEAPQQQAAVQQQVVGLLTTAIKHNWAVGSVQLLTSLSANFLVSTLTLVWSVLKVLQARQSTATAHSSSSSTTTTTAKVIGAQISDTAASVPEELRDTTSTTTTSSRSSSSNSTIDSGSSTASGMVSSCAAMVPWLLLLGRSFMQAAAMMSEFLKHTYSEAAAQMQQQLLRSLAGAAHQLEGPVESMRDALTIVCIMGLTNLPASIKSAAVMLSCDSQRQLPQQVPVGGMFGTSTATALDGPLSSQHKQQLAALGQALSQHCSSTGFDISALQKSTWALAEATAAAVPMFHRAVACITAGLIETFTTALPMLPKSHQAMLLMELGLGPQAAAEAADSIMPGSFSLQQLTFVALKYNPVIQSFLQQLSATGLALSSLPTAAAYNNPRCTSLAGTSEKQGVGGKSCRCAACQLAYYCCRGCQKQHWDVHKPVCRALQAKKAALPA